MKQVVQNYRWASILLNLEIGLTPALLLQPSNRTLLRALLAFT